MLRNPSPPLIVRRAGTDCRARLNCGSRQPGADAVLCFSSFLRMPLWLLNVN